MIVYAVNIHSGGGKVLLDALLLDKPFGQITHLYVDSRYEIPQNIDSALIVEKFKPTLLERLRAEFKLIKHLDSLKAIKLKKEPKKEVLFFGNLPPVFSFLFKRLKSNYKFIIYLQNAFLVKGIQFPQNSMTETLRLSFERLLLNINYKLSDEIWVQTQYMKDIFEKTHKNICVQIKPFLPKFPKLEPVKKTIHFLHVGNYSKHKNLNQFIEYLNELENWLIYKNQKEKINAMLIINENQKKIFPVYKNIDLTIEYNLNRNELFNIYNKAQYLVVTSKVESFFLPAYEAHFYGCKILASGDQKFLLGTQVICESISQFRKKCQ